MEIPQFIANLNEWGHSRIPFIFLVDFEMKKPMAFRLSDVDAGELKFWIHGATNAGEITAREPVSDVLSKEPIPFSSYLEKFNHVQHHLDHGDTFLTNLTISTKITLHHSLLTLFHQSKARYKLWYKNEFLVFSPEIFIQIRDGRIFSYPMKGTIDATIPSARERILSDEKELAEHVTIVDLIRNDLSQIAERVKVVRFRYVEQVHTLNKDLLQVSSEISGDLPADYRSRLGELLVQLLPAGSVSGAPKASTVRILREAEGSDRGYYTGVVGYFDGHSLDSGVMIRYIEQRKDGLYYRSGGGITTQSYAEREFREAIDKVYVPIA